MARKKSNPKNLAERSESLDRQFEALLRWKCTLAALVGALTAAIEAIPGLGRVLGLIFGEMLDAQFLSRIQRELVEETFALYSLKLPPPLHDELIRRVQTVGASASIAGDMLLRNVLQRLGGRAGNMLTRGLAPLIGIVSSAVSNASVTYAIGKRAQVVAKWKDSPITGMPDVLRTFSGIDERRVLDWSVDAVKNSLDLIGDALRRLALPEKLQPVQRGKPKRRNRPRKSANPPKRRTRP
jgi:hypothetical protein